MRWMHVVSRASASGIAGRIVVSRRASLMVKVHSYRDRHNLAGKLAVVKVGMGPAPISACRIRPMVSSEELSFLSDGLLSFVQPLGCLARLSRPSHVDHLAEGLEDRRRSRYAPEECDRFDVMPAFG
jgi:hypothetical protein